MAFPDPTVGRRGDHARILAIALPAILANSSAPLVGLVDTWAIGHLPGAVHLAAVGLGSVMFSYLYWAFGFLRMGTTGLVAQSSGRGDTAAVARVVVRSGMLGVGIGLALLALQVPVLSLALRAMAAPDAVAEITSQYFRIRIWSAPATLLVYALSGALFGLGRTRGVLALQLVLNVTNAALNLTLVVGFGMGVPGVALGTLLAESLACAFGVWVIARVVGREALLAAWREGATWVPAAFRRLFLINGFIFVRTVFLMTALALIMRQAAALGEAGMAASHVVNQFMLLMALGLDGFAHASEALAGAAWGHGDRDRFRYWVRLTGAWAALASVAYAALFWLAGEGIVALLTDIESVRTLTSTLLPLAAALPLIAVWCYHLDGVYIGATAAASMMVTMGISFAVYLAVLGPMTDAWGLQGLWCAVLVFLATRGLTQAIWYPRLVARLPS